MDRGLFVRHIDIVDMEAIHKHTQECTVAGSERFRDEIQLDVKAPRKKAEARWRSQKRVLSGSNVLTP